MKQHLQRLGKFFFLSALMLLISCQNDEPASPVHQHEASTGSITLKQFKEETKISNFSSVFRTASIAGIEGKGTESIDDFVIDTLAVEKYNSNHSGTSYSFFVYPINREDAGLNEIFNLVYSKDGSNWEASIFSLEKVSTSGNPDSYENIQMLYGKLQNNAGVCWATTFSFHCTRTGPCAGGSCDMCSLCVSTRSTSTSCGSNAGGPELPTDSTSPPDFGINNGGSGGAGGIPYATFMSALQLDPTQSSWLLDQEENTFFKAKLVEEYIHVTDVNAIKGEFKDKVNFLRTHYEMCQDIRDYLVTHQYFENARVFAWNIAMESYDSGLELDIKKSEKSPANIDETDIDTLTSEGRKFKCIYETLTTSPSFKQLFINTFGQNNRLNVKFEIAENLPNDVNGNCQPTKTVRDGRTIITNLIRINKNILNNSQSDIFIARVIIHEFVHAYLNIKKINCNDGANLPYLSNLQLQELIGTFYLGFNCHIDVNGNSQSQHDFIFNHVTPTFISVLSDIKNQLISQAHQNLISQEQHYNPVTNSLENFSWNELFYNMSLSGLHETESFQATVQSNPEKYARYSYYITLSRQLTKNCQ